MLTTSNARVQGEVSWVVEVEVELEVWTGGQAVDLSSRGALVIEHLLATPPGWRGGNACRRKRQPWAVAAPRMEVQPVQGKHGLS
jgi:hypothetical protein